LRILITFNGLAGFGLIVDDEEETKEEVKVELPVSSDHKVFLQQIEFIQHNISIISRGIIELKQFSSRQKSNFIHSSSRKPFSEQIQLLETQER
jgi:hypothetical protein